MRGPLIGRSQELGAITDGIGRSLRQRSPAVVLVIGEPGSGKSHLLAETIGRARPKLALELGGSEPECDVPLSAIRVELGRLADDVEAVALRSVLAPTADASQPLEPIRLFEATHAAIAGRPVVLTVDDLQWVDGLTVALLHYLARAAAVERQALALIAASRPAPAAHAFADALAARLGEAAVDRLELGPLDRESGIALARRVVPGLDEATATEVAVRASGSPFWIELLARTANEDGDTTEAVAQRFRRLKADARELLSLLAVFGRPVERPALRRVLGWDIDRLASAIADLQAAGLLLASAGTIRLAHDLIRQAAVTGLARDTRRDWHQRVADEIQTGAPDDMAALAEALDHQLKAGNTPADLARRVATSPRRRLLGADGLRLLDSIADALPDDDPDGRRLQLDLAQLATEVGEHESARRRWAALVDLLERPEERIRAAIEAARLAFHFGSPDEIRASMERVGSLGPLEPWTAVAADALRATVVVWREHRVAEGAALANQTLERARRLAVSEGTVEMLGTPERQAYLAAIRIAYEAATQAEQWDSLDGLADEAIGVARGLEVDRIEALMLHGLTVRTNGHYRAAAEVFRRAWDDARRAVLPAQAVTAGNWTARAIFDLGDIEEAATVAGEVALLVERVGDMSLLGGVTHVVRHEIELMRGDWRLAVSGVVADAEQLDPHYALAAYQWAAVWTARAGGHEHADEVEALLLRARDEALAAGCPRCQGELDLYSLEARVRMLDRVALAPAGLAAWDLAHPRPDARRALHRRWVGALVQARMGAESDAASELDALCREADSHSMAVDAAWLELDRAAVLARWDREASIAVNKGVGARGSAMGATTLVRLVNSRLRALGVRAWRPSGRAGEGAEGAGLTARELEVARLIAGGASNPESPPACFSRGRPSSGTFRTFFSRSASGTALSLRLGCARGNWPVI